MDESMREPADRLVSQVSQDRTRIIATDGSQYSGKKAPTRGTDCPRIGGAGSHAGPPCLRRGVPFLMISCSCPLLQLRLATPAHPHSLGSRRRAPGLAHRCPRSAHGWPRGRAHALLLVEKPDLSAPRRRGSRGKAIALAFRARQGEDADLADQRGARSRSCALELLSVAILGCSVASRGGDSGPATHLHCSPRADVGVQRKRF